MKRKIRFKCKVVACLHGGFDNTYHSIQITRCSDSAKIVSSIKRGSDLLAIEQTASKLLFDNQWIKCTKRYLYSWLRTNKYPIEYVITRGTVEDCTKNASA